MKLRLKIELEFDDKLMYGNDKESKEWFYKDILGGSNLVLLDGGELGDEIGKVRVLEIFPKKGQSRADKASK